MSSDPSSVDTEPPASRLRLSEPFAAIALFVLATACAALLLARPRAIAAEELPSLVLSAEACARVVDADARAAHGAPRTTTADALRGLLTKQGEMELAGSEQLALYNARREELARRYAVLVAELGEPMALRMRAEAVREFDGALDLQLPAARAQVVIGALGAMLQREGASVDGELTAPSFVARTLFKARWNLLHGLEPTHRFERIELQAYYGWQALHAERLPIPQRVEALRGYAKAGGRRIREALGVMYYQHDEFEQAAAALAAAYAATPSLRLRNYVLGARARAGYRD